MPHCVLYLKNKSEIDKINGKGRCKMYKLQKNEKIFTKPLPITQKSGTMYNGSKWVIQIIIYKTEDFYNVCKSCY